MDLGSPGARAPGAGWARLPGRRARDRGVCGGADSGGAIRAALRREDDGVLAAPGGGAGGRGLRAQRAGGRGRGAWEGRVLVGAHPSGRDRPVAQGRRGAGRRGPGSPGRPPDIARRLRCRGGKARLGHGAGVASGRRFAAGGRRDAAGSSAGCRRRRPGAGGASGAGEARRRGARELCCRDPPGGGVRASRRGAGGAGAAGQDGLERLLPRRGDRGLPALCGGPEAAALGGSAGGGGWGAPVGGGRGGCGSCR